MSDTTSSYGEPVEEPAVPDDVVGHAEAGLADAEAARRVAPGDGIVAGEPDQKEPVVEEPVEAASVPVDGAAEVTTAADYEAAYRDTSDETPVATTAEPVVGTPVVTTAEPLAETPVAAAAPVVATAPAVQPIFVQAPEAPRPRGNRAAAGAIGIVAALAFAVLYLAAWLGFDALSGKVTLDNAGGALVSALGTWSLWVTVVVFFLAFWLLGAIINRGRWGAWVVFGLLVGFASYGGHLLGQLFQAPFWMLTATQAEQLIQAQLYTPLAIAAFIIGRELTIWFGAWAAARGRRVTELNVEAQREYERTLEAGPQLVRQ
ncbi:ABC transporter [Microbacterium deminutum]|uniref:ABC transporter n=1 Tax=Microbacterium deminutum TaxID=344164 RepID=A0ABP5BG14_9MICO